MSRTSHPAIDAVTALIRARTDVVDTDNGPIRIHQPCLLQMLIIHLHASNTGRGGTSGGADTIPLNTAAWDLLVEIRTDTYSWADLLGVDPKPYAQAGTPRPGKPATPPIGKLLRAVAVTAATTARDRVAEAIAACAKRWARQIEDMLAGQPEQRDVRGARCPDCDATSVHEVREDPGNRRRDDGRGRFTVPALALVLPHDAGDEPSLYCRACGWCAPLGAAVDVVEASRRAAILVRADAAAHRDDHGVDDLPGQAA